jgi:hypothetical protein
MLDIGLYDLKYDLKDHNETAKMVTPVCRANMIHIFLTQAKYISTYQ